ncbi:MAG: long-chain acyl-CoA synthetase [Pseudomonadota bacterium]|jgi:long-chain acyl-CoA synthetase
MHQPWLKQYPQGVPAEIDLSKAKPIGDMMVEACTRFAPQTAYFSLGHNISYGELLTQSESFASWLHSVGMRKGDRIALMMPNLLQYPIALMGALRAGCVVVNCNPLYTPRELQFQLKDSGAKAIVVVENFAHTLQKAREGTAVEHVVVTSFAEMLPQPKRTLVNLVVRRIKKLVPAWSIPNAISLRKALRLGFHNAKAKAQALAAGASLSLDDPAFLQYTGGTTGTSKGAILTHRNMSANVMQAMAWIQPEIKSGQEFIVTALPLYHIFALTANCFTFMMFGARNLLIANPRDIPNFVKEWSKHPVTVFTGVNTLFNALLNHPEFGRLDHSRLRLTLGGGMAVQKPVAERWQATTQSPLAQAYGLTETSPAATINPLTRKEFNGSIGLPISSTRVEIRDDEGQTLPHGQVGEICIAGPQVTPGYWNQPEETAKIFTPDGFLKTGDMGYMDEFGFVYIVDRKKDMILVSGFNVYPNEIEEVVAEHPGVQEVAAIGVPDTQTGEAVKIFIVRKDPTLTEGSLLAHCRERLTNYKVPRQIEFRTELPKTNVGKILRRALREA